MQIKKFILGAAVAATFSGLTGIAQAEGLPQTVSEADCEAVLGLAKDVVGGDVSFRKTLVIAGGATFSASIDGIAKGFVENGQIVTSAGVEAPITKVYSLRLTSADGSETRGSQVTVRQLGDDWEVVDRRAL